MSRKGDYWKRPNWKPLKQVKGRFYLWKAVCNEVAHDGWSNLLDEFQYLQKSTPNFRLRKSDGVQETMVFSSYNGCIIEAGKKYV